MPIDPKKIKKLQNKVKRMYYEPKNSDRIEPYRKQMIRDFWDHHVKLVVAEGRKMAKKYKADENIVWLGALLHDISLIHDEKLHDELSAQEAGEILEKAGFDQDTIQKVKNIALTHRVKKYPPKTKEEKIVATVDALNHFMPSFYLGIAVIAGEEYNDLMRKNMEKLERDYEQKIFFKAERADVRKRLADFKKWFGFKNKK